MGDRGVPAVHIGRPSRHVEEEAELKAGSELSSEGGQGDILPPFDVKDKVEGLGGTPLEDHG